MLRSVALPGIAPIHLEPGVVVLRKEHAFVPAAAGWALFDAPSPGLPAAGELDVEIAAPLDGRRYLVRRALDVPDHWQVVDCETGWLAAGGPVEVPHWLSRNLSIHDEIAPRRLFRDIVSFSLPVTLAWLLEDAGVRERKTATLLGVERYRTGLRWLDAAASAAEAGAHAAATAASLLEGQDRLFDHFRRSFEATRQGSIDAAESLTTLQQALGEAEASQERLRGLELELAGLRDGIHARSLAIVGLQAQAERWRHWRSVYERALRAMEDHRPDWQSYQDAQAEIAKCVTDLSGIEPLRLDLRGTTANVMALRREQSLLQAQMQIVQDAQTAAADLGDGVHQQQQLEQQIGAGQEQALRLELVTRSLQQTLQETKRAEVLLAELDRQQAELDQLAPQATRAKKLQNELEEQQQLAREAGKQVDHLRFLETAARALGSHLDELRKGSSVTERLAVKAGAGSSAAGSDERSVAGHLREAVDHQIDALERQIRDWQAQSRDLSAAPTRQNQLRATTHQLEQELAAARQVELKLGGLPALKQHRKHLAEHLDQLRKLAEAQLKEQHDCAGAPARLSALRHDLTVLKDPRAERQALLRTAARKDALEAELRQVERALADGERRQTTLEQRLSGLNDVQARLALQEHRRDDAHEGYCTYLAQQAIVELASGGEAELDAATANLEAQRRLQEQSEARETSLQSDLDAVADAPLRAASLRAQVQQAESRARDWQDRFQAAAAEYSAAEENRAELRKRQAELATRLKADALLSSARATIRDAEVALGQRLRRDVAGRATPFLQFLAGDSGLALTWSWGEAPVLSGTGASRGMDDLDPLMQANCALALRLAVAGAASRFGTVFASGLGPLLGSDDALRTLQALPSPAQFLVPSAW